MMLKNLRLPFIPFIIDTTIFVLILVPVVTSMTMNFPSQPKHLLQLRSVVSSRTIGFSAATKVNNYQQSTTHLHMVNKNNSMNNNNKEGEEGKSYNSPFVNIGLVGQLIANQALLGSTIWSGGAGYQTLLENSDPTLLWIIVGLIGALPLLALSLQIETSESPLVVGLNQSTNMVCLRLFGSNPQPVLALVISALLSGITGIVEEVIFRGQLLPYLTVQADGNILVGATLSTLIFAGLHVNPLGFFKGVDAAKDALVLFTLQIINGGVFCLLCLTTKNLFVPILAHFIYDLYTFYKTHLDVTTQMEYAKNSNSLLQQRRYASVERKWMNERDESFVKEARESFYFMDTNRDGVLSRKELRIALFSYGINLSKIESEKVVQVADVDDSGRIDFEEFLEFIGPTGSTTKAVKRSVLGPI